VQITREIFQVGGSQLTSSKDAAIYLINFNDHAALVDAGCGDAQDRLIDNIVAPETEPGISSPVKAMTVFRRK
jgi:hypothetical protein